MDIDDSDDTTVLHNTGTLLRQQVQGVQFGLDTTRRKLYLPGSAFQHPFPSN